MIDFKEWAESRNLLNEFFGPMSQAGFIPNSPNSIPHKEYKPKNFDRYAFKPDEGKALEYSRKMKDLIRGDMLLYVESLAGYYQNDGIVKAYDDFLNNLKEMNIVL